ncbi:MAG: serine/threonine-protein kinase [Chloroflexi bacterium]|nr:serine/threonine-protein kinase [Chloroflexota bacterium]
MPRRNHRQGENIGRWTLIDFLGSGGNAEVWRASDGSDEVALKILHRTQQNSEPYQRFRQEIMALEMIGDRPDVVPLIAKHLPDSPSDNGPAWLAMPICVRLDEALEEATLREVVDAVSDIAESLADLHESYNIHHRDLKPANLYMYCDRAAISDFGLVDIPNASALTVPGRKMGPLFFMPDEMIFDAMRADPAPADVFSLSKTLWVLCTNQRWPPQGEQRAENELHSIKPYTSFHPLANLLDQLIERCTNPEPSARPTMKQVADDLRSWLNLDDTTPQETTEISAIFDRLRRATESTLRQRDEEEALNRCFRETVTRLQTLMRPLDDSIAGRYELASVGQPSNRIKSLVGRGWDVDVTNEYVHAAILRGRGEVSINLYLGVVIRSVSSNELEFGGAYFIGFEEALGSWGSWTSDSRRLPCPSITLVDELSSLVQIMEEKFAEWLERFTATQGAS